MTEPAVASIYNYRAVGDGLGTSGQPSEAQMRLIADAGFQTVVNLALHDDPRYSLADEAGLVRFLGMAYVHIPVQFATPTAADLRAFCDAMDHNAGRKLWVHCAANYRVSAFLGLYRVLRQGWKRDEAFALMHGVWEPNAVWAEFIDEALRAR